MESEEQSLLESLRKTQKREIEEIKNLEDAFLEQIAASKQRLDQLNENRTSKKKLLGIDILKLESALAEQNSMLKPSRRSYLVKKNKADG